MRIVILIINLLAVFLLISCDKDEALKQPADVTFQIKLSESELEYLKIDTGLLYLTEFIVEGEREEGDDIYFKRPFSEPFKLDIGINTVNPEIGFDIPQGVYNHMHISFETFEFEGDIDVGYEPYEDEDDEEDGEGTEDGEEEEFEDWDEDETIQEYYNTHKYSFVVEGRHSEEELPIRIEFYSTEYFEFVAENAEGENEIVLDKESPATGDIIINSDYWFENIPNEFWENAEIVLFEGEETIVVSEFINIEIFALLAYRVPNSVEVQIN